MFIEVAREMDAAGKLKRPNSWVARVQERRRTMRRRTDFDNIPIKPQRVFHEINEIFPKNTRFVTAIGLYQIASAQFQRVYLPRHYLICGQAGPLGWEVPALIGAKLADPETEVWAWSRLLVPVPDRGTGGGPPVQGAVRHHLFNNAYLGLIRMASKPYDMDFQIQLSFDNINSPENEGYGVDFVKVTEGFGCRATRVKSGEAARGHRMGPRGIEEDVGAGGGRGDHRAQDRHRHGPGARPDQGIRGGHRPADRDGPVSADCSTKRRRDLRSLADGRPKRPSAFLPNDVFLH
jgi:glyoxylate carboligase